MDDEIVMLVVEDSPADARLSVEKLKSAGFGPFRTMHALTLEDGLRQARETTPHVMLLDLTLPDSDGVETVRRVQEAAVGCPIIVLTGMDDESLGLSAVKAGAQDFVRKNQIDGAALARSIRYAVERKRTELDISAKSAALEETNAKLRQLTSAMTHDLQTPLATLTGATDALERELGGAPGGPVRRWLRRIQCATTRMEGMFDELTLYAKAGRDDLDASPVSLAAALEEVEADLFEPAARAGVALEREPGDALALGDRTAIHRVLQNVVGNAIKYTSKAAERRVRIVIEPLVDMARVIVSDTGEGVDPGRVESLFQPFTRASTRHEGTGLGLAIARQYMERMGGSIALRPNDGPGATVSMEFLRAERLALAVDAEPALERSAA